MALAVLSTAAINSPGLKVSDRLSPGDCSPESTMLLSGEKT